MHQVKTLLTILVCLCLMHEALAQKPTSGKTVNFLKVETGLLYDNYNSVGPRLKIEMQRVISRRLMYGIAFDTKWHLGHLITDQEVDQPANYNSVSGNLYYCVNPGNRALSLQLSMGMGGAHVFWSDEHRWGLLLNAGSTVSLRIAEKVQLFTSPLVLLVPVSEFNYTTITKEKKGGYYSFNLVPLGIRIEL